MSESSLENVVTFREAATNAVRYWEPRRVVYNAALTLVFLFYALPPLVQGHYRVTIFGVTWLMCMAIVANILYCSAYLADVPLQQTSFRGVWLRFRWMLFALGLVFAFMMTWTICLVMFDTGIP